MTETDCPFCRRITEGMYDPVGFSNRVVGFTPLNPVVAGHYLLVPRVHVADAAERPPLTGHVMAVAALYVQQIDTDCNIITSVGSAATQTVGHLHVHVVPRAAGDGLALPWTPTRQSTVCSGAPPSQFDPSIITQVARPS